MFVGRTQELGRLRSRLDAVLAGRGSVVFVTGEAGAGKSTLVEEFLRAAAAATPPPKVVDSACSEQYGTGEPYQPFIEAFRELLSARGRAGGKTTLLEVAKSVAPTWLGVLPVVGNVLEAGVETAMALKERKGGAAPKAASEEALFFQYTELLTAAATEQPVLLFIDDLHWADQASVTLLSHLARRIEKSRVLILGTYRPVDVEATNHPIKQVRQELERYGVGEELRLSPLDPGSLRELLEGKLGGPAAPLLLEWLTRRAGTNPLFFGALTDWLVDQGFASETRGQWELVRQPEEIEIPRSAEAALERRLERLDPEVYRVLEYAAVEGDEFHSLVLARLLETDELKLEETLEPIVRVHELIRLTGTRDFPLGEMASTYQFAHSLIQDILHRKLQGKRRILLHRRVAEILLELHGTETAEIDNKLAVHYDEGRMPERAYACAVLAADRASELYAHLDATRLLALALRNARHDAEKVPVLDRLGRQHRLLGRFSEAREALREAQKLAEGEGERVASVSLRRELLGVEMESGSRPAAQVLEELKRLVREAGELGADAEVCRALLMFRNMPAPVRATKATNLALRKALEIARRTGDPELLAEALYQLGTLLVFGDDPSEGMEHLRAALELGVEGGDRERQGLCHNVLGIAHLLLGRYERAVDELDAAAAAFREVGDPISTAGVRNNLGGLLTRTGEWERAEHNLEEALRIASRLEAGRLAFHVRQNLAELCQARGDGAAATAHWKALRERAREAFYLDLVAIADCGLAAAALEKGEIEEAGALLVSVREWLSGSAEWTEAREAYCRVAARHAHHRGDAAEALRLLAEAQTALLARDRYEWARCRLLEGEIRLESDPVAGGEAVRQARTVFEELGAVPMRERADALLARAVG